ncbi:MAG: hypothetical protein ABEL97_10720 [Salinibacter sp.]
MKTHVSLGDVHRLVLEGLPQQPIEHIRLRSAQSRVLAQPGHSPENVPASDNAGRDGVAGRAEDLDAPSAQRRVVEEVPAGHGHRGGPASSPRCLRASRRPIPAGTPVGIEGLLRASPAARSLSQ